ncbi:MAG TPA: hypothetical protein VM940_03315 [Chthoniobacterales bacterium]|nr:hypothetical protein [Chthoniobacterales bacterium]
MSRACLACALAALLGFSPFAQAEVTFALDFPDVTSHTNQNWDDPTHGSLARSTLQTVLNEIGREFAESATIQLSITSSMATAYAAGANTASHVLQPGGFRDGNTYIKIRTGSDVNGAATDAFIEYSFNLSLYADQNGDGAVNYLDFVANLKGLTRHEIIHILGAVSGIDPANPASSQVTRHDTFLFDSAGNPLVNPGGTVSGTANLSDPNTYFDAIGPAPNYTINHEGDFSHLIGIHFPYRTTINDDDRAYFRTLGYAAPPGKLLNISTRLRVRTGDAVLISGFIIAGAEPKTVLIRGIGPSLEGAGVSGALQNPTLTLFQGNTELQANDDWFTTQSEEIRATGLQPVFSTESAILRTLAPGSYTAVVRGKNHTTGVGLVEIYDLSGASDSKLANVSTRGFVETGTNVMIAGFIAGHPASANVPVIVRAIGPTLSGLGVPDALQDPFLSLHDGNGVLIVENDNWRDTDQSAIAASGFAPGHDAESAILITRPPGSTTAIVRGKNGGIGNALVEVYRLN